MSMIGQPGGPGYEGVQAVKEGATNPDAIIDDAVASTYAQSQNHGYMWNLDPGFYDRLAAFIAASEGKVSLSSGYRSYDHQQRLYNEAVQRYGAANASKWAAPPGRSNHNRGLAGDLSFLDDAAKEWAHANAFRFGLEFPMGHEPWHIEPAGLRTGTYDGAGVPWAQHDPDYGAARGGRFDNYETWREAYTFEPGSVHPSDTDRGGIMEVFAAALRNPVPELPEGVTQNDLVTEPGQPGVGAVGDAVILPPPEDQTE